MAETGVADGDDTLTGPSDGGGEPAVNEVALSFEAEVEGLHQLLREKERVVVALEEEVEREEAKNRRLREEKEQLQQKLEETEAQAQEALARYRERLLTTTPDVPPELVKGETVTEVDASLAAAQDLVDRVRRQLLAQSATQRVPSGVPTRRGLDLSTLSPAEKIAHALRGQT